MDYDDASLLGTCSKLGWPTYVYIISNHTRSFKCACNYTKFNVVRVMSVCVSGE